MEEKGNDSHSSEKKFPKKPIHEILKERGIDVRALGRKGGKKSTPYKRWARIKKCSPKCPIYPCPFAQHSKEKYGGECALKKMPLKIQRRVFNALTLGYAGLNRLLAEIWTELALKVELNPTVDNYTKLFDKLLALKKSVFGNQFE